MPWTDQDITDSVLSWSWCGLCWSSKFVKLFWHVKTHSDERLAWWPRNQEMTQIWISYVLRLTILLIRSSHRCGWGVFHLKVLCNSQHSSFLVGGVFVSIKRARNQRGNRAIAPPRNFQKRIWLLGTTTNYKHFAPPPRTYQLQWVGFIGANIRQLHATDAEALGHEKNS